jgi:DNA invertase Pin-like site-specific DNA recombinase
MSTRAVIYARISHDATGQQAGVTRQVEACAHLAAAREWELVRPELVDNDISAYSGARRPAYEELLALIRDRKVDAVIAWHMDRMCRRVADLVELLKLAVGTNGTPGVRVATVHGDLDLSSPIGRMFATILIAVAEYEAAHKGERHAAANLAAARNGKRRKGTPRPFGWQADHVTADPDEAAAIRWAADALLGGATVSAVMREWTSRGLTSAQGGQPLNRSTVATVMRNPRLAGLRVYRGEILSDEPGDWQPVLPVTTWKAVAALLDDPARKPPRGVRTLVGGLALCPCGNVVAGSVNQLGQRIYRCQPSSRDGRPGPHVAVAAGQVDEWVTAVIVERLSRPDLADLLDPPKHVDTAALRTESASIRRNLDELAADRAVGLVSRSQMLAATERANARLAAIGTELAQSTGKSVLSPFLRGEKAAKVWAGLDDSRRRAVIATLCTVTLHPAGRGARVYDVESKVEFGPPTL